MLENERNAIDNHLENMNEKFDELKMCMLLLLACAATIYDAKTQNSVNISYLLAGEFTGETIQRIKEIYNHYNKRNELIKQLTL